MISGGEDGRISNREWKTTIRQVQRLEEELIEIRVEEGVEITFGPHDDKALLWPYNDALVVTIDVAEAWIAQTFVDTGSSINIMYVDCWIETDLQPLMRSLF